MEAIDEVVTTADQLPRCPGLDVESHLHQLSNGKLGS